MPMLVTDETLVADVRTIKRARQWRVAMKAQTQRPAVIKDKVGIVRQRDDIRLVAFACYIKCNQVKSLNSRLLDQSF
ncbi:hypothetical protein J6590_086593 [Homalodisca vitripennis]|nr:hypothetical protein J6590_086593 [Homalodisca vitripennis]